MRRSATKLAEINVRFAADFEQGVEIGAEHWAIAVINRRIVLRRADGQMLHRHRELQQLSLPVNKVVHLGLWRGQSCFVIEFADDVELDEHGEFETAGLRSRLYSLDLDPELFALAGRALQLLHWRDYHRFCGHCGAPTQPLESERVLECRACGALYYPKISPCVIGIIVRGEQCLLARNARFPEGLFSAIAGFIEPGETAEAALRREIREEVGLVVDKLDYVGSQSWPFPSQLMLGFVAEYHSGEIKVDGDEIVEADWFDADNLPLVPPAQTISGSLIQTFLKRVRGDGYPL